MGNSTPCPRWCIAKAALRHDNHARDIADIVTVGGDVEVTLSQTRDHSPVVRVYVHTGDTTVLVDLDPWTASNVALIVRAFRCSPMWPLVDALTKAAAVLLVEQESSR